MRVIVTGGAGFIGSHVCKALHAVGHDPITVDNLFRGHVEAVKWGALERFPLEHTARLESMFDRYRPEAVIHLAGLAYVRESVENPDIYYRNNVEESLSLFRAMRACGVRNLVFSSSCSIYDPVSYEPLEASPIGPVSPYGRSKRMIEQILADYDKAYGFPHVNLRYFNAAGADGEIGENHNPETHLIPLAIRAALDGTPLTVNGGDYPTLDGTCIRDYVDVRDLAEAHVLALQHLLSGHKSDTFNLGSGRGFTVLDVVTAVEQVTGREIDVQMGPRREGDAPALVADCAKAKSVLGWEAKRTLTQMIESAVTWEQKCRK